MRSESFPSTCQPFKVLIRPHTHSWDHWYSCSSVLVWDIRPPKTAQQSNKKEINNPMGVSTTFKHLNLSWKPLLKVCIHHLQTLQPQLETSSQGLCPPPSNTSTSAGNLSSRFGNPCLKHRASLTGSAD